MDKRKEENIRVKNSITEALLKLMREKSFADISITEIIRSAQAARASFYRNYDIKDVLEQFRAVIDCNEDNYYTRQKPAAEAK